VKWGFSRNKNLLERFLLRMPSKNQEYTTQQEMERVVYSSNSSERLLHVCHVARRLAIAERTVRNLAARGEIPALKVGIKLWRFRERDIDAYLTRRARRGGQ
jgi:excisionase family DNA binding protein